MLAYSDSLCCIKHTLPGISTLVCAWNILPVAWTVQKTGWLHEMMHLIPNSYLDHHCVFVWLCLGKLFLLALLFTALNFILYVIDIVQ